VVSTALSSTNAVPATGRIGRLVGGVCFVAAALVEMVGAVVTPDISTANGSQHVLAAVASNPSGLVAGGYLAVLLPALLAPGLVAALGMVKATGRNLVYIGSCLALIGGLGHAVIGMAPLAFVPMVAAGANREQMVSLVQPIAALVFPIALPLLLVVFFGLLLFVAGLWRARLIPTWLLAVFAIWFVLATPLGAPLSGMPLVLLRELPFAVAFVFIGAKVTGLGAYE
jgi:hypothetical protein